MFYTVLSFTYRSWWGGDVGDDDEGRDRGGDEDVVGDDDGKRGDVGRHQHDDGDGRRGDVGGQQQQHGGDGTRGGEVGGKLRSKYLK